MTNNAALSRCSTLSPIRLAADRNWELRDSICTEEVFAGIAMVGWVRLFISAIASTLVSSGAFAAGPFGSIHVGNWNGGAYTDDTTGAFSHCAAGSNYLNGVNLIISHNVQRTWIIGFLSPNWNLPEGQSVPIQLTFDGQSQFQIFGSATHEKLIMAVLPNPAVNVLRKSRLMVATSGQLTVNFDLPMVGKLVPIIANCVDRMKANGVAAAGDFSITPPKPPIAPAAGKSDVATSETAPAPEKLINVTGTGFVISSNGHVLTNNHVISECVGDVHGNLVGESTATLRVVSTDETNDLALLQVPGNFKDVATIRATAVHSGDPVIVIGFPFHGLLTSDFTVTTGIISSLAGLFNDTRFLQISAPVQPGNSGGPLLDTRGAIVGVVAEKLNALRVAKATGDIPENINFAIKTGALRDFLDNSVVPYRTSEPAGEMKTAEIASAARAYTMLITCMAHDVATKKKK
jgi:S1-C subfamily serine protease